MPEMFDEIARKNCPHVPEGRPSAFGYKELAIDYASRLAQAAVEAMEQHLRDWKCPKPICSSGINPTCQSDILDRTQKIYDKVKS